MAACGHGLALVHGDISILRPGGPRWLPLLERDSETEPRFEHHANGYLQQPTLSTSRDASLSLKTGTSIQEDTYLSDKSRCQTKRIPFRKLYTIPTVVTI